MNGEWQNRASELKEKPRWISKKINLYDCANFLTCVLLNDDGQIKRQHAAIFITPEF